MKVRRLALIAAIVILPLAVLGLAATLLAPVSSAQQECDSFYDSSNPLSSDQCGDVLFQLSVTDEATGDPQPFEDAEAYGDCEGGYYNCSNTWVDPSPVYGEEEMMDDGPLGDYGEQFHWNMSSYQVEYVSCDNGNPNDEGTYVLNEWLPTTEFDAYSTCY